jgi:hypothetical protein
MPLVSVGRLSFSSYLLEEPIDRRTVHGNFALAPSLLTETPCSICSII